MTAAIVGHFRVGDRSDLVAVKRPDFFLRQRSPLVIWLYRIFLWLGVVPVGVLLLVYNEQVFVSILCLLVGVVVHILARQISRLQKTLHNTEFFNAMLASAVGRGYAFCAICKQDGEIIYMNRPFQELFPEFVSQPVHALTDLLERCRALPAQRESLVAHVAQGKDAAVTLSIALTPELRKEFTLAIEPVARPHGFVLIRGKETLQ